MNPRVSQNINLIANIAIIIFAILVGTVLIQKYFLSQSAPQRSSNSRIVKGTRYSLPEVDWAANKKTLVLALRDDCRFCTESMAFYRTLTEKSRERGVQSIAIFPNSQADGLTYLSKHEVQVSEVKQVPFPDVKISATPTLILIDENGVVENSWTGKLAPEKETVVLESL